jgi:hypothetical protein
MLGYTVKLHEDINYLKDGTAIAKSKVLEEIEKLRNNNFNNQIGDFINDFKNWLDTITMNKILL